MSTASRRDFVYRVFERQCEIGLANLERIYQVVGDRVAAVFVTGTDFGTQSGPFISPRAYRDLFMPFHRQVNQWIHRNTAWKSFIHSCGSVVKLIPDFIDAGFDILNPVQTSATGMEPEGLKSRFGDRLVFWGGGVDTQRVLPFGTPEEVRAQVQEHIRIFGAGGGFVFNTIHNLQASVPVENILALYQAVKDFGGM
jgi:uroporphyrinogen-III decarboxylase